MQFAVTTGRDGAPGAGEGASWRRCLDAGEGAPSPGGLEQSARTTSPPPRRGGRSPQDPENAARGKGEGGVDFDDLGVDSPEKIHPEPQKPRISGGPLSRAEKCNREKKTPLRVTTGPEPRHGGGPDADYYGISTLRNERHGSATEASPWVWPTAFEDVVKAGHIRATTDNQAADI